MKTLRSALALGISLSLILLAPGGTAWAQAVEIARGAPLAGTVPAAAPAALAPSLSLPVLAPAFSAPSAFAPAAALPAPAALPAAAPMSAAARFPAASARIGGASSEKASGAAPAATALEGARRELPDFSRMAVGDSKDAAGIDFMARVGELFGRAPELSGASAASSSLTRSFLSKSAKAGTPEDVDDAGNPVQREGAIDGLGNPSRIGGEHGPDDRSNPDEGGRGGSSGLFALGATGAAFAASGFAFVQPLLTLPLIAVSMILHEIAHAKVAAALGDPTAARLGRASLNPLTWLTHVDPVLTVAMPLVTYLSSGFTFGGAKPVPIEMSHFKRPARDMAKVAAAGPAVNFALAALGALAYAGAAAAGLGPIVLGALTGVVFINTTLAIFNLLPILPLDGGHILLGFVPSHVAQRVRAFHGKLGLLGLVPIIAIAMAGGGTIVAAAAALTHVLIGASFALTGVQLASAALPAMAALGMAIGSLKGHPVARLTAAAAPPAGASVPGASSADRPVDLVVLFSNEKSLTKDLHLTSADSRAADYVQAYQGVQSSLLSQLDGVGLSPDVLAAYEATPVASYRRINAATIRVDASKAADFEAALRAQGHKVFPNDRRRIVIPKPVVPEGASPSARAPIGMAENLQITKADAVQEIARKRFGEPDMNPWGRLKAALGFEQPAQPAIGVVDSGADTSHPLLKRVKEVKNETSGANADDIGHGSWVTSMVLNYVPWSKSVTHYKTFLNGGANLDDILKSLTAAANDGNLVISNSWGSDDGDPESPDSVLVKKLASEGRVMVFAAGNAGPGANTVGSPAIIQYKDAATGAIRVLAVAATDRNKAVASFSSRGPGSPKTAGKDGFAHRPDLAALGANTEGAWPAALGDADRTDPDQGPIKAISGTSMSTPSVAGALALLLTVFGVTTVGAKLDAVVNAVMATLEKTGKNGVDDEGDGFINVEAAYEKLYKEFNPGGVPPTAVLRYQRARRGQAALDGQLDAYRGGSSLIDSHPAAQLGSARTSARNPSVDRSVDRAAESWKAHQATMTALESEYPAIAHLSAGPIARAWAELTGRAPVPAHVAEYRRLVGKVRANEFQRRNYMDGLGKLGVGLREEMLEHFEVNIEPAYAADSAALGALLQAHPNAEYESSGLLGRAWLRLTGRGPKA